MTQLPAEIFARIERTGILAVLVVDRAKDAAPLARALLDGGIDAIELTLRTEAAIDAIRTIKRETPEMLVGAGTVLSAEQVRRAAEAGADFALAPGMVARFPRVVEAHPASLLRSGSVPCGPLTTTSACAGGSA